MFSILFNGEISFRHLYFVKLHKRLDFEQTQKISSLINVTNISAFSMTLPLKRYIKCYNKHSFRSKQNHESMAFFINYCFSLIHNHGQNKLGRSHSSYFFLFSNKPLIINRIKTSLIDFCYLTKDFFSSLVMTFRYHPAWTFRQQTRKRNTFLSSNCPLYHTSYKQTIKNGSDKIAKVVCSKYHDRKKYANTNSINSPMAKKYWMIIPVNNRCLGPTKQKVS